MRHFTKREIQKNKIDQTGSMCHHMPTLCPILSNPSLGALCFVSASSLCSSLVQTPRQKLSLVVKATFILTALVFHHYVFVSMKKCPPTLLTEDDFLIKSKL